MTLTLDEAVYYGRQTEKVCILRKLQSSSGDKASTHVFIINSSYLYRLNSLHSTFRHFIFDWNSNSECLGKLSFMEKETDFM